MMGVVHFFSDFSFTLSRPFVSDVVLSDLVEREAVRLDALLGAVAALLLLAARRLLLLLALRLLRLREAARVLLLLHLLDVAALLRRARARRRRRRVARVRVLRLEKTNPPRARSGRRAMGVGGWGRVGGSCSSSRSSLSSRPRASGETSRCAAPREMRDTRAHARASGERSRRAAPREMRRHARASEHAR